METPIHITRTERVDDIPWLLAQMDKMNIAAWLAYILSDGNDRLNSVQGWADGILMTLGT